MRTTGESYMDKRKRQPKRTSFFESEKKRDESVGSKRKEDGGRGGLQKPGGCQT